MNTPTTKLNKEPSRDPMARWLFHKIPITHFLITSRIPNIIILCAASAVVEKFIVSTHAASAATALISVPAVGKMFYICEFIYNRKFNNESPKYVTFSK